MQKKKMLKLIEDVARAYEDNPRKQIKELKRFVKEAKGRGTCIGI